MCPPGCYHAIRKKATRRGLLKAGFTLGISAAVGAVVFVGGRKVKGGTGGPSRIVALV